MPTVDELRSRFNEAIGRDCGLSDSEIEQLSSFCEHMYYIIDTVEGGGAYILGMCISLLQDHGFEITADDVVRAIETLEKEAESESGVQ